MSHESPNLLHEVTSQTDASLNKKPTKWPSWLKGMGWPVALFVTLLVVVFILPVLYGSALASTGALTARSALKRLPERVASLDFAGADEDLLIAEAGLADVQKGFKAFGAWRYAPWIGTRIQSLESVSRVGGSAIAGARELVQVAREINEALNEAALPGQVIGSNRSYQDLTSDERKAIMAKLYELLPKLRLARERIAIASNTWSQIPQEELLLPVREVIAPYANRLAEADTALKNAVDVLEWLVPLSGVPEQKTYLVLLQNSDELRPTGGFIGNIGVVTVDAGHLESFEFEDVYALDQSVDGKWNEPQPIGLAGQFLNKVFYLRDANWSPDAPSSAATIMDFYVRENALGRNKNVHVDGVIFLTPEIFKGFLRLTGPITVEGRVFDEANFFDKLQFDVDQGFLFEGKPVAQRKEIVKQVGDALIQRLMTLPASSWPTLLTVVTQSLNQGDMIVAVKDKSTQEVLDRRGWAGRTLATDNDYLWVVDANINAQKTDGVVDKEVLYSINEDANGDLIATTKLQYRNNAQTADWRYTRYRSYTRVYVPEGSEFITATGCRPDVYKELGKQVFGCHWSVDLASRNTISFTYKLPPRILSQVQKGEYVLLAQKQPGAKRELTLDLSFGKNIKDAVPPEDRVEWGDLYYRYTKFWDLTRDFHITF
ncbi:MAG: DUF4012 domain-containing protein [Candidatus Magasanikbacteria bacterium]|nr:DUF4012 domain-containing protein [Candidatus Magasanikbacteria bacterium]